MKNHDKIIFVIYYNSTDRLDSLDDALICVFDTTAP